MSSTEIARGLLSSGTGSLDLAESITDTNVTRARRPSRLAVGERALCFASGPDALLSSRSLPTPTALFPAPRRLSCSTRPVGQLALHRRLDGARQGSVRRRRVTAVDSPREVRAGPRRRRADLRGALGAGETDADVLVGAIQRLVARGPASDGSVAQALLDAHSARRRLHMHQRRASARDLRRDQRAIEPEALGCRREPDDAPGVGLAGCRSPRANKLDERKQAGDRPGRGRVAGLEDRAARGSR
eukprot:3539967-Rhodomonas_salina.1